MTNVATVVTTTVLDSYRVRQSADWQIERCPNCGRLIWVLRREDGRCRDYTSELCCGERAPRSERRWP